MKMFVADLSSSELRPVRKGFRRVGGALYLSADLKSVVKVHALIHSSYPPACPPQPT
jgi:hypothetical protein